ncbi:hypothetical protein CSKR_102263 [Clonorchis sinensis]|uniref:Uncharacterized protein n=1 Tax=Clonorchis sinensis TaxID=79923 RepID=A0A419PFY0_CLOSI|nr:hypothetical protein CSKR_102263 [Clonorchis sinensis]
MELTQPCPAPGRNPPWYPSTASPFLEMEDNASRQLRLPAPAGQSPEVGLIDPAPPRLLLLYCSSWMSSSRQYERRMQNITRPTTNRASLRAQLKSLLNASVCPSSGEQGRRGDKWKPHPGIPGRILDPVYESVSRQGESNVQNKSKHDRRVASYLRSMQRKPFGNSDAI